jgi:hypothetical protein
MATYKVTSDRVDGKKRGDTLHDSDLAGVNVAALVEGGHIEAVRSGKPEKNSQESEQ